MQLTMRAARMNKGLTQEEASKEIKVSLATLRNYESGKSFPNVPVIRRIEKVYDVAYSDLIFLPSC